MNLKGWFYTAAAKKHVFTAEKCGLPTEEEKHSFTSFECKDPIPTASNVCNCKDINDFSLKVIKTCTISDAINDWHGKTELNIIGEILRDKITTITLVVDIAGHDVALNISYPVGMVFEIVTCGTCGKHLGWCTEIGGRAFSINPVNFVDGLIKEEVVKYVEAQNDK